MNDLTDQGWLW